MGVYWGAHECACARVWECTDACADVCACRCVHVCGGVRVCVQGRACLSRDFQNALKCKLHKFHAHKVMVTLTNASEIFLILSLTVSNPMSHVGYEMTGKGKFAVAPTCGEPRLPC